MLVWRIALFWLWISVEFAFAGIDDASSGIYPDPLHQPYQFASAQQYYFKLQETPIFNRVVSARMYSHGFWVLKDAYSVTQVC